MKHRLDGCSATSVALPRTVARKSVRENEREREREGDIDCRECLREAQYVTNSAFCADASDVLCF